MYLSLKKRRFGKFFRKMFSTLFFAAAALLISLSVRAERLSFKIFTTENGLPQNVINRVMRDSRGFLWFSTEDGLSRFDGQVFVNYNIAEGLPHSQVNFALEAGDGSLWLATNGGIARMDAFVQRTNDNPKLFTIFSLTSTANKNSGVNRVNFLYQDRQNTIWAGTDDGLFRLEKNGDHENFRQVILKKSTADVSLVVRSIAGDSDGNLWIAAHNGGLFRLSRGGRVTHFSIHPTGGYDPVRAVLIDSQNELLVGHEQIGLLKMDVKSLAAFDEKDDYEMSEIESAVSRFAKSETLADKRIFSLFQSSDNHLWIGTATGIAEFDGANFQNYTQIQGLPETPYNWFAEDVNGNIWATTNQGAVKITRRGFVTFQQSEGIGVRSIWESADGELRVLTPDGKFHQLAGEKFVSVKPSFPIGTTFEFPQNVIQDSQGDLWAATKNGLYRFPKVKNFSALAKISPQKIKGLPGDFIMNLYEDSHRDIWISLADGKQKLVRWQRKTNTLQYFDESSGVPPDFIAAAFAEDAKGTLWAGNFGGGLLRYRNGSFAYFAVANGVEFGQAQALTIDKNDVLWMGTKSGGAWKISETDAEKPTFSQLTTKEGISSDNVTSIVEDALGRIYLGTERGIDWIDPKSGNIGHYSTVDGLNDNKIGISFRDSQCALWFGTANSLAKFIPQPLQLSFTPSIFITELQVAGKNLPLAELAQTAISGIEINSGQSPIVINFAGIDFAAGQALRFQHKLAGEDEWSAPTLSRSVNFANLASGNYQFLVRAVTSDGVTSQNAASVSFKILSPIYLRWWFLLLTTLIIGALIYLFYRSRFLLLLEMERIRKRIATDLHDDIGANLTRISLLSEMANQQAVNSIGNILTSIANIARESVASMNDIVWAIAPEHDSLLDLTRRMRQHAEEVFTYREIDLDFNAPVSDSKLSVNVRRDILLIFKEAVSNAAKYSDCRRVKIDFRIEHSILSLKISDDGKGFDYSKNSSGNGLLNMKTRAEKIGGKFEIQSVVEKGTSITVTISHDKK